jgi:hypothetical protein
VTDHTGDTRVGGTHAHHHHPGGRSPRRTHWSATLTIDVLSWSGTGLHVRLDQHAVLVAGTVIATVVWATGTIVRAEQEPLIKEVAQLRQVLKDVTTGAAEEGFVRGMDLRSSEDRRAVAQVRHLPRA